MSSRIHPELYPQLHEQLADQFAGVVRKLFPELADALQSYAAEGLEKGVAARLADTARRLREESSVRADAALEQFLSLDLSGQGDETDIPHTITGLDPQEGSRDTVLLEQILARELANAVRTRFGGSYVNYLRRLETISGNQLRDDQHPLGARTMAMALIIALKPFTHVQPTSLHLRPIILTQAAPALARLVADTDATLRRAGILAFLPPAAPILPQPLQAGAGLPSHTEASLATEREEPYTGIFPGDEVGNDFVRHASHQVLNDIRASAVMAANPLASRRHRLSAHRKAAQVPQIEDIERDAVVFARQCHVAPYSQEARTEFFRQVRQQVVAAGGDTHVLTVIDLVASLFDYAASDRRLPEGARILLWRLQMPAITLASLDAGYLGDDSRSIRRLTEQLAAIAVSYPDEMRPDKTLYQRLQTVVRAVEIVAHAFHVRSQVLSEQVDQEYRRATEGMRQLLAKLARSQRAPGLKQSRQANRRDYTRRPPAAREKIVSEDIRRLLEHRLGGSRVPESVTLFLYDVWLRHLRTAALRDGTDSQNYRVALQVVDNLLWTLGHEGADPRARNELVQSIPPMLSMLSLGIKEVGEKPENFQTFFDEIFLIHVRRMQGHGGSAVTVIDEARNDERLRAAEAHQVVGVPNAAASAAKPEAHAGSQPSRQQETIAQAPSISAWRPAEPVSAPPPSAGTPPIPRTPVRIDPFTSPPPLNRSAPLHARQQAQPISNDAGIDTAALLDPQGSEAASQRLHALIDSTRVDDLPSQPRRFNLPAERFATALHTGRWMELISRSGRVDYAKVVWINERKTMALMLTAQRRVMTREIDSLIKRVRQNRLHFVW